MSHRWQPNAEGWVVHRNGIRSAQQLFQRIMVVTVVVSSLVSISTAFYLPLHRLCRNVVGIDCSVREPLSKAGVFSKLSSSTSRLEASPSGSISTSTSTWSVKKRIGRGDALTVLEDPGFLPSEEYGDRITFGRQAAEKEYESENKNEDGEVGIMMSDDPRLAKTYAEFPLTSLDILLDAACHYLPDRAASEKRSSSNSIRMVDIGSGLGRIVLYSALTRGAQQEHENDDNEKASTHPKMNWEVCGIEISSSLHTAALDLVQTGVDREIFEEHAIHDGEEQQHHRSVENRNSFSFRCGSATDETGRGLLKDADLVFAYSTAFKATGFDPDVGALILDTEEWSLPLSEACPDGCVVVTTDRALNPDLGWRMVERIEVPNPEVLGTTGFIQVLEKERRES